MAALPLILSKPEFTGIPKPISGPYKIPLTSAPQQVSIPVTSAIYTAFAPKDQWRLSVQRNGNSPSGPYPNNIIYFESIDQQKMDAAFNANPSLFKMNIGMFKTLTKNINHTLRISLTDASGQVKAIAPNVLIMIT